MSGTIPALRAIAAGLLLVVAILPAAGADLSVEYTALTKLTLMPVEMDQVVSALCRNPNPPSGPHATGKIHIWVNDAALRRTSDAGKCPVGALIVKEKWANGSAELITAMEKMADRGTSPTGDSRSIPSRTTPTSPRSASGDPVSPASTAMSGTPAAISCPRAAIRSTPLGCVTGPGRSR